MNHTTMRFSRTMRQSGTQYANAIERSRRDDSGITIVLIVGVILAIAICWSWL